MDSNDPKEFDDPQVFDDPKGISTESMNLDNPKVYSDTFIFDGLVYLCSNMGSDSLFLIGCSFFNLLAFAKIVQPGKHRNFYGAATATISTNWADDHLYSCDRHDGE